VKAGFALFALVLMFSGCSQNEVPALAKTRVLDLGTIDYLWTVQSAQGEVALGPESQTQPDQALSLWVATDSQPAKVLVATFQDRSLSMSPPPDLVKVPANREHVVPWKVPTDPESAKVFTVFLPAEGETSDEIEALLEQCSQQKAGEGPAAQRLYDRLSEWAGEDRSGSASQGHQVVEVGAALSTSLMSPEASGRLGSDNRERDEKIELKDSSALFDWRKTSRQAAFGVDVHPVVICDFVSARR
jgi:hypothetical protein